MNEIHKMLQEVDIHDSKGDREKVMSTQEKVRVLFLNQGLPVIVRQTDETGDLLWAVEIPETDFWLDAFDSIQAAFEFCHENGLPILRLFS